MSQSLRFLRAFQLQQEIFGMILIFLSRNPFVSLGHFNKEDPKLWDTILLHSRNPFVSLGHFNYNDLSDLVAEYWQLCRNPFVSLGHFNAFI